MGVMVFDLEDSLEPTNREESAQVRARVDDPDPSRVVFPATDRKADKNAKNAGIDERRMREIDRDGERPHAFLQRRTKLPFVINIEFVE